MNKFISILILTSFFSCDSVIRQEDSIDNEGKTDDLAEGENMTAFEKPTLSLPNSKDVIVLRTDFSSDKVWENICVKISNSGKRLGYRANIEYANHRRYEGLKEDQLLKIVGNYEHSFIFILDSITVNHNEFPLLCVDLIENTGDSFRLIPSEIWGVENNLSIANMDFEDFLNSLAEDGIFRGFK